MKEIIIERESSGIRLDKFLAKEFFSYSRGEIIRNIKNGSILVNSKKVKPSYILHQGDTIISNFQFSIFKLGPNPYIKIKVIYEDKNIIVIDKPAGVQVHPDSKEKSNTVVNWLIAKFPEIKNVHDNSSEAKLRPGIVHRLDKDTSGIMVIARNMKAYKELKDLFKERGIEKKYLAIVYGTLKNKSGVIEKPIARSGNYRKQVIAGKKTKTKIREALTEYKVLKEFNNYSLLEVTPKTGRMHQIRIHLFSIGYPIVGDRIYKLRKIKKANVLRQMLHAELIKFKLFGKSYSFKAELPQDIMNFAELLTKDKLVSII